MNNMNMVEYNKYDLFIFDLDDTLIKTEYYHYISWKSVLNMDFSYEYFISKFHSNKENNIHKILTNVFNIQDCNNAIEQKNNFYFNYLTENKDKIKMIDGVQSFLKKIAESNKIFVIVSNSPKIQIDFFCELFPILQHSSKNYYREMFQNKKPNPQCYLNVLQDFPNKKMIGFEDSITGIHSMSQVGEIDMVFINIINYYYYSYILQNYKLKTIIMDYSEITI